MPIRPELRKFYSGPGWKATRERIKARAGNCCEFCGVPNHKVVLRAFSWWTPASLPATVWKLGGALYGCRDSDILLPWRAPGITEPQWSCFLRECCRWVGIVCTCAHLNHVSGDDRDENLRFLCQWCHLEHDVRFHHETRATRKDAARPILVAAAGPLESLPACPEEFEANR